MNRLVFSVTFLLLAAVIYIYAQGTECGPNAIYSDCASPCPATCRDVYDPPDRACITLCITGCSCIEGYILNDNGVCIPREKCLPPSCPRNKTWQSENTYVSTCDNIDIKTEKPGCYCDKGYLLNRHTDECVLPEDCPRDTECGPNAIYSDCASPCPATCRDLYDPPDRACITLCITGCSCIEGYILNDNGVCIPREKCLPPRCPRRKIWQSKNIHVRTCDNININPKKPGCYCDKGYLLNRHTDECVLPKDCPRELKCCVNEQESECINPCPATCLDPEPPQCLPIRCEKGCICQPSFLRDTESGLCVDPKDCPGSCLRDYKE